MRQKTAKKGTTAFELVRSIFVLKLHFYIHFRIWSEEAYRTGNSLSLEFISNCNFIAEPQFSFLECEVLHRL